MNNHMLRGRCKRYSGREQKIEQRSKFAKLKSKGRIYGFGGRGASGSVSRTIFCYIEDENDFESTLNSEMPLFEGAAAASTSNGEFYIFGGASCPVRNPLWNWRPESNLIQVEVEDDCPCARSDHSLVSYDNSLLLFGGFADLIGPLCDMWILETSSGKPKWKRGVDARKRRYSHCAEVIAGEVYVFGGNNGEGAITEFEKYDLSRDHWSKIRAARMPCSRYGHSSCVTNRRMFIYGGIDSSHCILSDLWMFSLYDSVWSAVTFEGSICPGPCAFSSLSASDSTLCIWQSRNMNEISDQWEVAYRNNFVNTAFDSDSLYSDQNTSDSSQMRTQHTLSYKSFGRLTAAAKGESFEMHSLSTNNHLYEEEQQTREVVNLLLIGGKFVNYSDNQFMTVWNISVKLPL